jgi:hypothetical protein
MALVCIVYDLHAPGQDWPAMDAAIKALGLPGGRAFNTTWFLATSLDPQDIFDRISHVADADDSLMVFRATAPGKWHALSDEWTDFLKKNL